MLTGRVWDANNNPGVFAHLSQLQHGDTIEIHAWGQTYVYEVRTTELVAPNDISVLGHSEYDILTLLTCEDFNEWTDGYTYRRAVMAVLVDIK